MSDDKFGEWHKQDLAATSGTPTANLYHYTRTETAISGILANRTIRLSPFQGTNDLWESRPLWPSLTGEYSRGELSSEQMRQIWEDVDRFIRGYSKVACFTRDWTLPDSAMQRDALRGWRHLSMWAHYGAGSTGVCLEFDSDRLVAAFEAARSGAVHQFSGNVEYRATESGVPPYGISIEQAEEFGVDAVALHYAWKHRDLVFLRKHADWATESEFRLIRTDLSVEPFDFDITDALTGVILGDDFPMDQLPSLLPLLDDFTDVELSKIWFQNRVMLRARFEPPAAPSTVPAATMAASPEIKPRRTGPLAHRLASLGQAERESAEARAAAAGPAEQLLQQWLKWFDARPEIFGNWPDVVVNGTRSTSAIPQELRRAQPGVPGEGVAHEDGIVVIAEHQPQYSYTFVLGIAVQVWPTGSVRLHACIEMEEWRPGGNHRNDLWRTKRDAAAPDASAAANLLVADLADALPTARRQFDELRGLPN